MALFGSLSKYRDEWEKEDRTRRVISLLEGKLGKEELEIVVRKISDIYEPRIEYDLGEDD